MFTNPDLAKFKPRELIEELKARGYKGTLTYEIHGFVRGCSSAVMILRPANDHGKDFNYVNSIYYQVFLTDSKEIIQNMMHGIIYGKWTFVKRGENFGIKLVKVLPKIHKISLDMIAKDIFRSENK